MGSQWLSRVTDNQWLNQATVNQWPNPDTDNQCQVSVSQCQVSDSQCQVSDSQCQELSPTVNQWEDKIHTQLNIKINREDSEISSYIAIM